MPAVDLGALGVSRWAIGAPGVIAAGLGLAVWNGLGRSFGLGGGEVRRGTMMAAAVWACAAVSCVGVLAWREAAG